VEAGQGEKEAVNFRDYTVPLATWPDPDWTDVSVTSPGETVLMTPEPPPAPVLQTPVQTFKSIPGQRKLARMS